MTALFILVLDRVSPGHLPACGVGVLAYRFECLAACIRMAHHGIPCHSSPCRAQHLCQGHLSEQADSGLFRRVDELLDTLGHLSGLSRHFDPAA